MANPASLIMGYSGTSNDVSFSSATTGNFQFTGFLINNQATGSPSNGWTESLCQTLFQAGTAKLLQCNVTANGAGSSTVTLMDNSSALTNTFSIAGNGTGQFSDATHSDSINSGDLLDVQVVPGSTSLVISVIGLTFIANSNTVTRVGSYRRANVGASAINMMGVGLATGIGSSSTNGNVTVQNAFTLKNLYCNNYTNNGGINATCKSWHNSALGNLATPGMSPDSTGSDTSHSDTLSITDTFAYQFHTNGSAGGVTATADLISSNGDCLFCCGDDGATSFSTSQTKYYGLTGSLETGQTSDLKAQVTANSAFQFSNLSTNIISNNITSSTTISLRAGAASQITLSIGGSVTGVHTDSSDTYTANTTDLLNYQIITGATGTTMTIGYVSINGNATGGAPVVTAPNYQCFNNVNFITKRQAYNPFGGQLIIFG